MPRKVAVVTAASVTVPARGRGKGVVTRKPAATVNPTDTLSDVEVPPCPICCEPRDATDMEFYPCPCGFQLCLFCYKRLKNEYSGQCPACRASYTVDPEDCKRIVLSRASETSKPSVDVPSPGSLKQHRDPPLTHAYSHPDCLNVQIPPPPPPPPPKPEATKRPAENHLQHRYDLSLTTGGSDSLSGLPSGATWATPQLSRSTTQELDASADAVVDDTAWPSLAESLPSLATTPVRQPSFPTPTPDTQLTRKLSSTTIAAPAPQHFMDTTSTSSHLQSSSPPLQQKFHTAQVTSMVSGIKRAVCVPLELAPNSAVEPVPEAAAVLPNVKAAVREGRMSSADGAHHLVTLLRQTDRSNRPSLLQAGRLPPGFADPAYRTNQLQSTEDYKHSHLQPQGRLGGTVVELPSDRSTLHSPFQHSSNAYHSNRHTSTTGLTLDHSGSFVQPTDDIVAPTGHAMWQSTCLPGLEMSNSLRSAVPVNVSAIWGASQELSGSHSASASTSDPQMSSRPPPPGFGPSLQSKQLVGSNGYHLQASPSADASRVWLPGQTSLGNGSYASRYVPPGIGAVGSARPSAPPPYRPLDFQPCIKSDFPRAPGTKT